MCAHSCFNYTLSSLVLWTTLEYELVDANRVCPDIKKVGVGPATRSVVATCIETKCNLYLYWGTVLQLFFSNNITAVFVPAVCHTHVPAALIIFHLHWLYSTCTDYIPATVSCVVIKCIYIHCRHSASCVVIKCTCIHCKHTASEESQSRLGHTRWLCLVCVGPLVASVKLHVQKYTHLSICNHTRH